MFQCRIRVMVRTGMAVPGITGVESGSSRARVVHGELRAMVRRWRTRAGEGTAIAGIHAARAGTDAAGGGRRERGSVTDENREPKGSLWLSGGEAWWREEGWDWEPCSCSDGR